MMDKEEAWAAWLAAIQHKEEIEKEAAELREAAMGWREKVRAAQKAVYDAWQVVKATREATGEEAR